MPSVDRRAASQSVLNAFVAAARSAARADFEATLSQRDPTFAPRGRELFDNLSALPLSVLVATVQPGPQRVTGARRDLLGADAWTQPVTFRWRLSGDGADAEHTVWLSFVPDGERVLIAGTEAPPAARPEPQPSWWTGPIEAGQAEQVTVVVGTGQSVSTWIERARQAQSQVARHLPASTGYPAVGPLVLEVPATAADFAAVVGTTAQAVTAVAATTIAAGTAESALRVVVNPEASRRLTSAGLTVTLAHEVVHIRTRSAASPAPTWLVEGLADETALAAYPEVAPLVAEPVLTAVERDGPPPDLPDDAALDPASAQVGLAYGQAWMACRYVADTWGRADLGRLYRGLDQGRGLDEATRAALGVSAAEFVAGWRADLTARARRR